MGDVLKEGRTGERARGRDMVLVPRPAWASITAPPSVVVGEELAVMPLRDGDRSKLFEGNSPNSRTTKRGILKKELISLAFHASYLDFCGT